MKIKKAVIPAAGMGTRFLPFTKAVPKEMLPVVDIPALQLIIEEAVNSGIEDILIVTGRGKNAIEDHFDRSVELENLLKSKQKNADLQSIKAIDALANIFYVRQKEPLGLGHAVLCARRFVGSDPFAVLLGDDLIHAEVPVTAQLLAVFEEKGSTVVGCQHVGKENVHKYGIVDGDDLMCPVVRVKRLTEKPRPEEALSDLAVLGRYVLVPEIFAVIEKTGPGANGEIQLTDALNSLAAKQPVWACNFQGRRYDIGDKQGFLEATVEYALRREDLAAAFKKYLKSLPL